jgi:hypothetical protein
MIAGCTCVLYSLVASITRMKHSYFIIFMAVIVTVIMIRKIPIRANNVVHLWADYWVSDVYTKLLGFLLISLGLVGAFYYLETHWIVEVLLGVILIAGGIWMGIRQLHQMLK